MLHQLYSERISDQTSRILRNIWASNIVSFQECLCFMQSTKWLFPRSNSKTHVFTPSILILTTVKCIWIDITHCCTRQTIIFWDLGSYRTAYHSTCCTIANLRFQSNFLNSRAIPLKQRCTGQLTDIPRQIKLTKYSDNCRTSASYDFKYQSAWEAFLLSLK